MTGVERRLSNRNVQIKRAQRTLENGRWMLNWTRPNVHVNLCTGCSNKKTPSLQLNVNISVMAKNCTVKLKLADFINQSFMTL